VDVILIDEVKLDCVNERANEVPVDELHTRTHMATNINRLTDEPAGKSERTANLLIFPCFVLKHQEKKKRPAC
jgi:hypothetical protein